MAGKSSIEWTEATWNPVAGCTIISPGCKNCYAMRLAHRLSLMGSEKYDDLTRVVKGKAVWTGTMRVDDEALDVPRRWRRGRMIFVNSMSDLFHEGVSLETIQKVFRVMAETPHHTYQVLTKRAERVRGLAPHLEWADNIWMGVSVENRKFLSRIDALRAVPARVRFLSLEPLLGPLGKLNLNGVEWVIVGGESGPGARPIKSEWVRDIRDQCIGLGPPSILSSGADR